MKKLLIGLTVLFSFLFFSNVSASVINGTYTINEDILNSDLYYNDFLTDNIGHTTYYDALISSSKLESFHKAVMNNGYKYYFYDNNYLFVWNDDDIIIGYSFSSSSSNSGYCLFGNLYNPNNSLIVRYSIKSWVNSNKLSPLNSNSNSISLSLGIHKRSASSDTIYYGFNTVAYANNGLTYYHFQGFNTNKNIIYTASLPIEYGSSYSYYQSVIINGKKYNDGDLVYSLGPFEPELNISVIEKNDYLENIKINFNIWDTEKYSYEYKLTGMEVWEDITENDFEYISYSNNTIYIQMIDKTTNESVLNATYTFSNINETIPDITFNESIPNSCKILKNGTNYIVCKEIKANFNNYYGINNYLWSYSADRENWTQIYNDKFIDLISENKAIYFKLYDRYTNETLKYMTYNITGIELIPSDLGQYITFNGKYENNNYKLDIIFYNYDNELYNYYYSTDGENWTQLSLAEMSNYASIYSKYKSFNFYKDMTVYVKIEDKEANYINSATYQIKIPNVGLFDTINNFKVDNKILNYFTNIYNQIRTSDLGNYIFMLIVTSIILLIIKSARR